VAPATEARATPSLCRRKHSCCNTTKGSGKRYCWQRTSMQKRWALLLPAGAISLTGYGVFVYGTSALIVPIREQAPSLSPSIVPYVAGLRSVTFAVTNLFFGQLMLRRGSPTQWVASGCFVAALGLVVAAMNVASPQPSDAVLLLSWGVGTGLGSGLLYMSVFQTTLAWFPDRKGLVAGLLGFGQGLGAMTWNAASLSIAAVMEGSTMLLLYGGIIIGCWAFGMLARWPPDAQPKRSSSSAKTGLCMCFVGWAEQCSSRLVALFLLCLFGMAPGFGIFTVLDFWLEEVLKPSPVYVTSTVVLACTSIMMVARPATGFAYDALGVRRYTALLISSQLAFHVLFVLQQTSGFGGNIGAKVAPAMLMVGILACFSAAITSWAPLTIDVLRKPEAVPIVLISLPTAQGLSAAVFGLLLQSSAVQDAMTSFIALMSICHLLSFVFRWWILRETSDTSLLGARTQHTSSEADHKHTRDRHQSGQQDLEQEAQQEAQEDLQQDRQQDLQQDPQQDVEQDPHHCAKLESASTAKAKPQRVLINTSCSRKPSSSGRTYTVGTRSDSAAIQMPESGPDRHMPTERHTDGNSTTTASQQC